MDCKDALEILYDFLDEELEELQYREFEEHIQICDRCRCCFEFEKTMIVHIKKHAASDRASEELKKKIRKLIEDF